MTELVTDFRVLFERAPAPYLVLAPHLTIVAVSDAYLARDHDRSATRSSARGCSTSFPTTRRPRRDRRQQPARVARPGARSSARRTRWRCRSTTSAGPTARAAGSRSGYWSPVNSPVARRDGEIALHHPPRRGRDRVRPSTPTAIAEREATQALQSRAARLEHELYAAPRSCSAPTTICASCRTARRPRGADHRRPEPAKRMPGRSRARSPSCARSEEQLRQAQKMEAVGRLAGGVAHDFNNLLSVILSYQRRCCSANCRAARPCRRDLPARSTSAGQRAAELTRQLLAFSRQQVLEPQVLDLNDVVAGMDQMLRAAARRGHRADAACRRATSDRCRPIPGRSSRC